jgi:hypothetical protein
LILEKPRDLFVKQPRLAVRFVSGYIGSGPLDEDPMAQGFGAALMAARGGPVVALGGGQPGNSPELAILGLGAWCWTGFGSGARRDHGEDNGELGKVARWS